MAIIDPRWLPSCSMKRVICHWTAGGYSASDHDRLCYHILITGDGTLVRGVHSIADNVTTADGKYAAHTLHCNTGSIGITVCAMRSAQEQPLRPGPFPMTREQWTRLATAVAELCRFYKIAVTPQTVLGHGEVQANLGIPQNGKWDPMALPWEPTWDRSIVGTHLRATVSNALEGRERTDEQPARVSLFLSGTAIAGVVVDGEVLVPVATVAGLATTNRRSLRRMDIRVAGKANGLAITRLAGEEYVPCEELARVLGLSMELNAPDERMDVHRVNEQVNDGTTLRRTAKRHRRQKPKTT